jgi:PAS domain S-box-containing protein
MVKNSRDYLRQQALQNNLDQAKLGAAFASNYIDALEAHVQVFATRPDIRQAVLNGNTQQIQPTLAQFVQIQTPLNGVGIYDINGIQLTYSLTGSTTVGQSFADRNWFQGVISSGQPYLGTPILAKANNIPVCTYAVPILDDQGQIRAVFSAGISLQKLSDALVNVNYSLDTRATLIDTRNGGTIIADSDEKLLLNPVSKDDKAMTRLISGETNAVEESNSAGMELVGFTPVSDLPWGIMVATPEKTAFAIINTLTQRAIIFGILIILAAGILGVFLVLGITRPLNRLVFQTKEIGRGNLEFKVDSKAQDEIGDLSRAFIDMTVKLKNTMVSRDELVAEVTERKQAEENLQGMTIRQRELLAAIPDIVMEVDNNKVYTWANQAGLDFFGEDVIGKEAFYYFEGEQDTYNMVKPLFNGEESTFYLESWQRRKDGQKRLLGWWCRVLKDAQGNVRGALSSAQDITEHKLAEEQLQNQYAILKSVIESPNTPIFSIDKNYCYTSFNSIHAGVMKSIYGVDINIGKSLLDYMSVGVDRESAKLNLDKALKGEHVIAEAYSGEETLKRSYFIVNHSPVRDIDGTITGALVFAQDVTESKQAEAAVRESEEKYRKLFDNAEVGMYRSLLNGTAFLDINNKLCEIFGYTREEMMANTATMRWNKPVARQEMVRQLCEKSELTDYEVEIITKSGAVKTLITSIRLYTKEGYLEGSAIDITERKQLEIEKEKYARELTEKNTELERFTYTVSHDLRSPLVTVKTFLGYLEQDMTGSDAERIKQDMFFMGGATDKMDKLLGELLEMSRVGRIINPPVEVTFRELVEESKRIVAGAIVERGVKIHTSDESIILYGDRSRLVEIWQNLVENAVKFMGDQPSPQIDIGVEYQGQETIFFVRDNGIGIEPRYQPKLFNLFEKINSRTEGAGMGLAITKRIVELYQGRIWVESEGLGHGSCFRFTLPGALKDKEKGR